MSFKLTWKNLLAVAVVGGILFALLGMVSVAGWEYSNSNQFCANACHAVHPQEPFAHEMSAHAKVDCVECHIGRMSTFASMIEKTGHMTHAWSMITGWERPLISKSLDSARNSCESCHTLQPHKYNIVKVRTRFDGNRRNTESKVMLTVRLEGRHFGGEERRGVDWHASGAVKYLALDPQQLDIRRVEATLPDGSTRIYEDAVEPVAMGDFDPADLRTMDCLGCHNRAGHPFRDPEELIDEAMARGDLNPELPFLKARIMEVMEEPVATPDEALEHVRAAWQRYLEEFPDLPTEQPEAWDRAQRFAEDRMAFVADLMSRFEGGEVDWNSFPDHNGHKNAPGCFRCHNGRLQDAAGTPIPVNCTTCHSIPMIIKNGEIPDFFLRIADQKKPDYHADPGFMAQHSDLADEREEECEECHEGLRYGARDRGYCSNSGCHDVDWEYLELEALQVRAEVQAEEEATAPEAGASGSSP